MDPGCVEKTSLDAPAGATSKSPLVTASSPGAAATSRCVPARRTERSSNRATPLAASTVVVPKSGSPLASVKVTIAADAPTFPHLSSTATSTAGASVVPAVVGSGRLAKASAAAAAGTTSNGSLLAAGRAPAVATRRCDPARTTARLENVATPAIGVALAVPTSGSALARASVTANPGSGTTFPSASSMRTAIEASSSPAVASSGWLANVARRAAPATNSMSAVAVTATALPEGLMMAETVFAPDRVDTTAPTATPVAAVFTPGCVRTRLSPVAARVTS